MNEVWYIAWLVIGIALFFVDDKVLKQITNFRNKYTDQFFRVITNEFFVMFLVILLAFVFFVYGKDFFLVIKVAFFSWVIGFILKWLFKRKRPYNAKKVKRLVKPILNYSFPSSHAMVLFSLIPIVSQNLPEYTVTWIIVACLISLTRVYAGVHYASDLVLGSLFGYITGLRLF
ncbi:phosphatase PAP2 family protein [Candidatus Woesearchaeota archaeon]|nr:phosphatase PAP2 family protein [Candidatus Woesearchaeota archaeon]